MDKEKNLNITGTSVEIWTSYIAFKKKYNDYFTKICPEFMKFFVLNFSTLKSLSPTGHQ